MGEHSLGVCVNFIRGVPPPIGGVNNSLLTSRDNCLAVFAHLTSCISALWMSSNRLKLNAGKTLFTCLAIRYQLAKVDASVFVVSGARLSVCSMA